MRLACVTVPNFRIALEMRRGRGLAGHPVAIGEPPPGANAVVECSAEATAAGIRAGMPLRDARTLVPDLAVLPPDPVFYDRSADAMLAALEAVTPLVEPAGDGSVFTELLVDPLTSGAFGRASSVDIRNIVAAERAAAARLLGAITNATGVTASAGVADNRFIAGIAATTGIPGAITIVRSGEERAFVAPLSTERLPVSYETHRKLALYALRTIGDVAQLPAGAVQAQFGREGRRLYELSRGMDTTPFRPRTRIEPVTGTVQMPAPTVNTSALLIAARQLIGRLLQHPNAAGRQVRQLRVRFALLEDGSWERTLTFREPIGEEERIGYVLKKLIEPLQLAGPVEEMSLEFLGMTGEMGKQQSLLFAEQARRRAQLVAAIRQLKTQFGGGSAPITRVVEVEPWSRIPERRYALIDYDL
jgi:DNA polymerase-4/protein ImuB